MLTVKLPYFYSAMVTVECQTPLSIKASDDDLTLDTTLVRDVNGYPTIPGTTIAGVLRHVAQSLSPEKVNTLFGEAKGETKQASQIQVSFGFIHNHNNQPIMGLDIEAMDSKNNVDLRLKNLMPILRDQVRLNEYGAASDGAKMDRTAVPKGTRFTFELNWATATQDDEQWFNILAWLSHPEFRLGGLTKRGFGKVAIESVKWHSYDFREAESRLRWKHNHAERFNAKGGEKHQQQYESSENYIHFKFELEAEDFWRIGQGAEAIRNDNEKFDEPDIKPYTEAMIDWQGDKAQLKEQQVVIPASGIKGALRHRTLFHFRRLMNDSSDDSFKNAKFADMEMQLLFGNISQLDNAKSRAGSLILDDIYLAKTPATKVMMHNKIDRFTGGTMDGALFNEQLLYKGGFVLEGNIKKQGQSKQLLEAFRFALLDLLGGRLPLGGGTTKGHGYFGLVGEADFTSLEMAIQEAENHPQFIQTEQTA